MGCGNTHVTTAQKYRFTPHFKPFHATFTTMQTININDRFTLKFRIKKSELLKIQKLLLENSLPHETWQKTPFGGIIEFQIPNVNLRKAEIIRQLLKNITVYE